MKKYATGNPEKFLTTQHERDQETGFDYRGARFYDSDIARFLSLDPLAKEFPAWSAYNYVMGNPIMLIDPDGRESQDWFLSQKTGQLVYARGKSELTQGDLDNIGSPYDVSDYKRIGADDMFGKELPITLPGYNGTNQLDRDYRVVDAYATGLLMNYVGLEKAQQVNITERKFISGGYMGAGEDITTNNYSIEQNGPAKIDYVKSNELNQKFDIEKKEYPGMHSSIIKVNYTLTKPYGQANSKTSYFNPDKKGDPQKTTSTIIRAIELEYLPL